jgi:hypothetical protein
MRYQVVVLAEEMQGACDISTVSFKRHSSGGPEAGGTFSDFEIRFALTDADVLSSSFDDNYLDWSVETVYSRDSIEFSAAPDQWLSIDLDQPYWYPGDRNLVIEVLWSAGVSAGDCIYTWQWNSETLRCTHGGYASPTGSQTALVPHILLSCDLTLEQTSFADIKSTL